MEGWVCRSSVGSCGWPLSDYGLRFRACTGLDGARPLTTFDLEGAAAFPVDELFHGLQTKIDWYGQILDVPLQLGRADALCEGAEALSLRVLGLVVAHPPLDRFGHALGGQAQLEARAEGHVGAFVYAAHVRDVGGDRVLAHFDRGAVEADVGDVVLGAAVGAAAHLDVDLARERV